MRPTCRLIAIDTVSHCAARLSLGDPPARLERAVPTLPVAQGPGPASCCSACPTAGCTASAAPTGAPRRRSSAPAELRCPAMSHPAAAAGTLSTTL